jgi:hypothetical protein
MPYTVTYSPGLVEKLNLIWLTAADRREISEASDRIDHTLKHYPEIRPADAEGLRQLAVGPLLVDYLFSPDDCRVTVVELRYLETPSEYI